MRHSLYWIVCVLCLVVTGCKSEKEIKAEKDAFNKLRRKELDAVQTDTQMLVPDWYRSQYTANTDSDDNYVSVVYNSLMWRIVLLYVIILLTAAIVAASVVYEYTIGTKFNWFVGILFGGGSATFAVWFLIWLICSIVVPIFSPGSWIPFSIIGCFVMVFVLIVAASVIVAKISRSLAKSTVSSGTTTRNTPAMSATTVSRYRRVIRAVVKGAFVALASGIAGKIGGWAGGIAVLLISGAVAAWFELPSDSQGSHQQ